MAHCVDKNEETSEETLSLYRQKERERERVDTENGWLLGWLVACCDGSLQSIEFSKTFCTRYALVIVLIKQSL